MYRPVPAKIDLPQMEREMIAFWQNNDVFHRSLRQTADGPQWTFYEGPPTANGTPGVHHVEARVFKDLYPRYRTMKGYHVPRKAGWDCHGLPVELAVERELGFNGKPDIEAYGIEAFNQKCRESVLRHVDAFSEMTSRMGYWVDMDQAYWTMSPEYIDSVWWSLKKIFDDGLLEQDHRVSPFCPRCGTTLSDHELAQGYETVVDPSVFVTCEVLDGDLATRFPGVQLLVWTTTPWTLVSNTAVAVSPEATYVVARAGERTLVVAEDLLEATLGDDAEVLARMPGRDLEGLHYRPPFDFVEIPDAHYVIPGDFVTTSDGSGIVHLAPAFGADDLAVCRGFGLPVVNPVRPDGTFEEGIRLVGGQFFKHADEALVADMQERGLLFKRVPYEHAYPHCWRCHTPLIYYALPSWYIRTTAAKDALLAQNEATNWYPETIQWGRYGDWLRNNIDWALSRSRYWGTPLPIWRCENDHLTAVGSRAELAELADEDVAGIDPHRPYVDDITFECPQCEATATRVPEVIDCWYDSGAMPFAQFGYPTHNVEDFEKSYPADFICEAIDQTRGWFYTLMAVGTLVTGSNSYRNVVCLGHILDAEGRKMSKHLGNVLEPIPLMDAQGADALRWFMLASGSPWQARRVSPEAMQEVVSKVLSTLWSIASFQALYGGISDWEPGHGGAEFTLMDRWALSRTHSTVRDVDAALQRFDSQSAGRLIADLIDDLSNWYVRRSRRRFWNADPTALQTLHVCLRDLLLIMAPFTPFITERLWQDLFATAEGVDSVHLAAWPTVDEALIDEDLEEQMALVRRLVELGRAARAESGIKIRQPLSRALVAAERWADLDEQARQQIADELNVLSLESLSDAGALVHVTVKPNFRTLGKRFGKRTPLVAAAIGAAEASELAAQIRRGEGQVQVEGETLSLTAEEVIVTEVPQEGWTVASGGGESLALDLHLDDELLLLGTARDIVRTLQQARKDSGFEVTDRITVLWQSDDERVAQAFAAHGQMIGQEVLATEIVETTAPAAMSLSDPDMRVALRRA
ncbi:MAG: isoleucine--tRNA ligase [Actinobacteria bacterium]|nr:MAG: isoleucine--tRNA ligase [Actinomycetota bacterium]